MNIKKKGGGSVFFKLLENRPLMFFLIFVAVSLITVIAGNVTINQGTIDVANNLTVDTNIFYVDSNNNRVGIGLTNPSQALDVNGSQNVSGNITSNFKEQSGQLYIHANNNDGYMDLATDGVNKDLQYGSSAFNFFGNYPLIFRINKNARGAAPATTIVGQIIGSDSSFMWNGNMSINNSIYIKNASLGIGTSTLNAKFKLTVAGDENHTGNMTVQNLTVNGNMTYNQGLMQGFSFVFGQSGVDCQHACESESNITVQFGYTMKCYNATGINPGYNPTSNTSLSCRANPAFGKYCMCETNAL